MGTPESNAVGYYDSSVMTYVKNMTGRLMLVHGLIDENVHFRHTARLIKSLIEHRRRYDLVLFPSERHSPHKLADRIYMEDIIYDYFNNHLRSTVVDDNSDDYSIVTDEEEEVEEILLLNVNAHRSLRTNRFDLKDERKGGK
eukprot:gene16220-22065_t